MTRHSHRRYGILFILAVISAACANEPDTQAESSAVDDASPPNAMARALEGGGTVFVIRPSELTPEQGAWTARVPDADYVFTSLESGPWDMPGFTAYLEGMRQTAAASPDSAKNVPVLLRIPPLHEIGLDSVRAKVQEALRVGASGIIFPHLLSRGVPAGLGGARARRLACQSTRDGGRGSHDRRPRFGRERA
jgi:hypothetical protein